MKNKVVVEIHGVVSAYHSVEFLEQLQKYLGKNVGVLNGGGGIRRVADAEAPGRIRGGWYEMMLEFWPERDQHFGAYTERECPFAITAKTTEKNADRMQELIDGMPLPRDFGGYLSGVELKYRNA